MSSMVAKFLLVTTLVAGAVSRDSCENEDDLKQWEKFKVDYDKHYATKDEEEMRKGIFMKTLKYVQDINRKYERGEMTYGVGINAFSDLTSDEFRAMYGLRSFTPPKTTRGRTKERSGVRCNSTEGVDIPDAIDWREKGGVTEVGYQGSCGACWAYSAVGCLEGRIFARTNMLIPLSVQNLIDCSHKEGNNGCLRGQPIDAFFYIKRHGGLATERAYPYKEQEFQCRRSMPKSSGTKIKDIVRIRKGDERELQIAVATSGPVSVNLDTDKKGFKQYKQGVYSHPNCTGNDLDHSALVVGYGTSAEGEDYWLVKNSWGTRWGDQGYIKIARNRGNMCGIATQAVYPTLYD